MTDLHKNHDILNFRIIKSLCCLILVFATFSLIAQDPVGVPVGETRCREWQNGHWVDVPCPQSGKNSNNRISWAEKRQGNATKFNERGNELSKQGKTILAVKNYQKAHKRKPGSEIIFNNLKSAISEIPDNVVNRDKETRKSWWKVKPRFKFHDWADIWKGKEDQGDIARKNESGKLNNEAFALAQKDDFGKAMDLTKAALDLDPNDAATQKNIQNIKDIHVARLNQEMAGSDYEDALVIARHANGIEPDNPATKEALNKIEVENLIKETTEAIGLEATEIAAEKIKKARAACNANPNDAAFKENLNRINVLEMVNNANGAIEKGDNKQAMDKLNSALEIDPNNQEIKAKIKDVESEMNFELNRIKYTQPKSVSLNGVAVKQLTGMSNNLLKNDKEKKVESDRDHLDGVSEIDKKIISDGFDNPLNGTTLHGNKGKEPTGVLVDNPAYKQVVKDIRKFQEDYRLLSEKIDENREKIKDPSTSPEEVKKIVAETKEMKMEMEVKKTAITEKVAEKKEIITKSFHIDQ